MAGRLAGWLAGYVARLAFQLGFGGGLAGVQPLSSNQPHPYPRLVSLWKPGVEPVARRQVPGASPLHQTLVIHFGLRTICGAEERGEVAAGRLDTELQNILVKEKVIVCQRKYGSCLPHPSPPRQVDKLSFVTCNRRERAQ